MGESGTTSNVHLHLSFNSIHPDYRNAFLNTARLFDPLLYPAILSGLHSANLELLHDWADSSLFRIIWPYNQTINQFEFIHQNDTTIFNKEAAYQRGAAYRDRHDCLPNIRVFAYPFNAKQTAKSRYLSAMNTMPAIYPASPHRDTNSLVYGYPHIPIQYDSLAFVYDFVLQNTSPNLNKEDFIIKLRDVWGYTVEGRFASTATPVTATQHSIKIYPNPIKDDLNFIFAHNTWRTLRLISTIGEEVWSKKTHQINLSSNIQRLAGGLYFLLLNPNKSFVLSTK